jgi:5-methylcytosine-specific restriction endonuclease McrA
MADAIVAQFQIITREDAKAAGLARYFTGIACVNGHMAQRFTSSTRCIPCQRESSSAYKAKNPDKFKEWDRISKDRRKEQNKILHAAWMKRNPDKNRANVYRWRQENPEKASVLRARRYQKHKERFAEYGAAYSKANPHVGAAASRRRRARLRGAEGSHTASEILALGAKQKWRCACCKAPIKDAYNADHITPISKGGSDYITNIQLLCETCNKRKAAKDPIEWANQIGRLL